MTVSYKETIFLPRTSFPMKGNLPTQEPKILEKWQKIDLYKKLRENAKDCEKFILHDGPPFANGHIHMGTSLNKIVKDVVIKAYQMRGYDAPYVPGWDCHGLPIERQIEEKARKAGKVWEDIPIAHIRSDCRKEAKKWVDIQRSEFKRLGVLGDWENPYLTMDFHSESLIVKSLFDFLMMGNLYKGVKPIMWSVVEKTALADAEIEYHDKTSSSIYVRFPVSKTDFPELKGSAAVIWTTTPWTFPGNRAVCFGPEVDYLLIKIKKDVEKDSDHKGSLKVGETLIIAKELLDDFKEKAGIESCDILKEFKGEKLGGTICHHPFHGKGYEHDVPLLPGDHVTIDQGTGLVHTAPGHGEEDFFIGKQFNLEVPETVGPDGLFYEQVPLFAGQHVFKADDKVIEQLQAQDALISADKIVHSYPCSWRSKAPLIYRTTPQWFVSMEKNNLREKSLKAIEDTNWVPAQSRNRIQAMMNGRPDWCLSRQRAWGIPIPLFVSKTSGDVLKDEKVNDRIVEAFSEEGTDIWFTKDPQEFLGKAYVADDYEQVKDIADVWFESGASYRFVLQTRKDLAFPASLYLEGSDQHRGWFQVSLLESCALEGIVPFKSV
ncbi:MAG: isoleucine--tRNA ligase, partial [Alphaproteobacteria bacterium]|nr:isoleucine--tRNA ligase [Alphaproteobacteria bacterium]